MVKNYRNEYQFLWMLIFAFWTVFSFSQNPSFKKGVKQGSIKVKFTELSPTTLKNISVSKGKKPITGIQAFDKVSEKIGVKKMHRLFPENPNPRLEAKLRKHKLHLWYVMDIDVNQDPQAVAQKFKGIAEVKVAEVERQKVLSNYRFTTVDATKKAKTTSTPYFNDPKLGDQWHYENTGQTGYADGSDINLFKAWDVTKGSPDVIVSIHDQGVDVNHPDLQANIWANQAELNGIAGVDDDKNGYVDDIHGWNFDKKIGAIDAEPHGTHVAGTVAAVNNNGIGVCGIAGGSGNNDGTKVMSVQSLGGGNLDQTFIYAADNGAVISQNSWGYTSPGSWEESVGDAIDYFIEEAGDYANSPMKGGIVIFAAGNSDADGEWYPAYYESTISVSSIGPDWKKASYSNYGTWVDVAAPGGETSLGSKNGVLSTLPKSSYGFFQGTSMACPHVSGIAALALANRNSQLTPEVLKTKLLTGVVDIDSHNPGYEGKLGSGLIDTFLAIQNNNGVGPETISDLTLNGIAQEFANLSWTVPADVDDVKPVDFRIYYHTEPITQANIAQASYKIIKNTASKGETIQYSVDGLLGLTKYYFAVISGDRWNNLSALSNEVVGTTNAGPKIDVDENSKDIVINVDASSDFKGNHNINILNNADGLLRWEFFPRHKESDYSYNATKINYPVATATKVASSGIVGKLKVNASKAITSSKVTTYGFTPIEKKYSDNPTNVIGEVDDKLPNSSATKFTVTEADGFNLTHVQAYLKVDPAFGPLVIEVYKGAGLSKQNLHYAQEFVPYRSGEGPFYVKLDEQLNFNQGETFSIVIHVPVGNKFPLGMGYENVANGSENCSISFDLGKTWESLEVAINDKNFAWNTVAISSNKYLGEYLTLDPTSGEITGNSTQNANLLADGTSLINGSYYANAILKSNDGNNREFKLPVTLNVSGQLPVLKTQESLDFSSVFSGKTKEMEFVIQNKGLGNYNDIELSFSNPNFELVDYAPYQIAAGEEVTVKVRYKPTTIGNDNGVLKITSASSANVLKVILFGVSTEPTKIVVTPMTQLIDNITLGDQVTATIMVENQGKAALKYFIPNFDTSGVGENWTGDVHKYGYKKRSNVVSETTPIAYEYSDISGTGTDITSYFKAEPNRYFPLEMGFDFPYYDKKMQTLFISHQGFTAFDKEINPINLPSLNGAPYSPKGYISPLGTYVILSEGGSVHYKVDSDKVIVQFTNVTATYGQSLTAQMVLYPDGNIRFFYDNITYDEYSLDYLNILIEDMEQQDGILVRDYDHKTPIYSGLALGFDYPGADIITSISNAGGILMPGETAQLDVVMETVTLNEGLNNRYINIISNDPTETQTIPLIQLNITSGGTANLTASETEINFGDVFQGATATRKIALKNKGTAAVTLTAVTLDTANFQIVGETTATIAPGLAKVFDVSMPTTTVGNYTDILRFTDSNSGVLSIPLAGNVLDPPGIVVTNLDPISTTLNHGDTEKHAIQIENNGIADLEVVGTGNDWLTLSVPVSPLSTIPNFTYDYEMHNDGSNYQWLDIRKNGTQISATDNIFEMENYWNTIKLPWDVSFYGKNYSDVHVGMTGIMTFDTPTTIPFMNRVIPSDEVKTLIAPYWAFAAFDTTNFKKEDVGLFLYTDEEKIVISWENFVNFFGGLGDPVSAQVIFYKNGTMKFQYKHVGTWDFTSSITTIGLQNGDQTDFVHLPDQENIVHGEGLVYVISPAKKHVIPAGTTLNAQIDIDARNLYAGQYEGKLKLRTNVPNQEMLEKPISLTVNGAAVVTSNVTEINYGEVMVNPAVTNTKEFEIKNSGSAILQLSNVAVQSASTDYSIEMYVFTKDHWGGFWSWINVNDFWGGFPQILPGESNTFRINYVPTAAGDISDFIVVDSNVEQFLIPIKATVTLPPALAIQTKEVNSTVNYLTDTDTQNAIFDNTAGQGILKYDLSIDYLRKVAAGITSTKEVMGKMEKKANAAPILKSFPAAKNGVAVSSVSNFNRVLAHESSNAADNFFGLGGTQSFTTATRFNAGKDGFTLSHFQTYINASDKPTGTLSYEIRAGGTSVADATIIVQGEADYAYTGNNGGDWLTLPIKEVKGLYPNEDFYIIVSYPYELGYVQGAIKGLENTTGRYTYELGGTWYDIQEPGAYPGYGWMVRAGEEQFVSNSWVAINGTTTGSMDPGATTNVQLDFVAANGLRGDQHAVLNIRTNDPANTLGQIPVKMHINEAPVFANVPVNAVQVNEMEEVTINVGVTDPENNSIKVTSTDAPAWVTFALVNNDLAIKLAPGYENAGNYTFHFTATDAMNAAKEMVLNVEVINTNRAPIVIKTSDLVYSKLNQFDVVPFANYFSDPDNDAMTFEATIANQSIATVTIGQELGTFVIQTKTVGETMVTLKATDSFGLSIEQQIKVEVKKGDIAELNLFPNPVVNTLNIKWEDRWVGDVTIEIVSSNGAIVRRYEEKEVQYKTYSEYDLSSLTSGVYFIRVSGKEGTSSVLKFIKRSMD